MRFTCGAYELDDDAHGLYRKYGFVDPDRTYLERPGERPEQIPRIGDVGRARQPAVGE